ncbi:SDR family NAD(P)-dependent oxidoreductase [Enterobacter cloacae]|uniref:SDR family NAD(P)-dependent oxidoreductase n=1 Tax=Enterobacter cloacae TaxID=550 RepID=A0A2T4Y2D0_ENTCL|nr:MULTISPECIES: SDR family oxidoreductase [Enterobacter]HDT2077022.1 SDR family oxidoreductase [Enterobacter roggenkampii]HEG2002157.1 SDR family oxidoreductase [Enterobacter asburiae]MBM1022875.1 SDR family oxidoreductase [Enterobacter sp. E1]MCD2457201.1 SDR family oxidoreductase [Enterobacter cloacae complex sp. 2021EL-01261]MDT9873100.1 SDR family oxidoreductase [Enterobacter cloacae]
MNSFDYTGKTALITGASSGIGRDFARQLANRGVSLILIARSEKKLQALATELVKTHGVSIAIIVQDLVEPDAISAITERLEKLRRYPDILINCAGFATYGPFGKLSIDRQRDEINVNCLVPVELTHAILPGMLKKGSGVIINVASTAALQPDPYMAIYGATKAFLLSFSSALWAEYRTQGIRILALCPGATDTAFFDVVNAEEASVGKRMPVDKVVTLALRAVDANRSYLITGCGNWLLGQLHRFVTRKRLLLIVEKILRPRSP